jgi:hypothetical protein
MLGRYDKLEELNDREAREKEDHRSPLEKLGITEDEVSDFVMLVAQATEYSEQAVAAKINSLKNDPPPYDSCDPKNP